MKQLGFLKTMNKKGLAKKVEKKYPITECFQYLLNMYTKPQYTELTITAKAWIKLHAFINLIGDYEISGFGRVVNNKIIDFDIIKQEVKAAYVESNADSVLDFIRKIPAEQRTEWVLDWHSHVNMGTTPSGTDWTNYADMLKARMNKQFPAMIVNKKGNVTAMDIICDGRHTDINIFVEQETLSENDIWEIYTECKEKVETLCTVAPPTQTKTGTWAGYQTQHWYGGYDSSDYYERYTNDKGTRWWEDERDASVLEEENDTDELIDSCTECGEPLLSSIEKELGICQTCFNAALEADKK